MLWILAHFSQVLDSFELVYFSFELFNFWPNSSMFLSGSLLPPSLRSGTKHFLSPLGFRFHTSLPSLRSVSFGMKCPRIKGKKKPNVSTCQRLWGDEKIAHNLAWVPFYLAFVCLISFFDPASMSSSGGSFKCIYWFSFAYIFQRGFIVYYQD